MERFVPFEKQSKRRQREENKRRRKDWNGMSPVTRRPENPKAYNRKKARKGFDEPGSVLSYFLRVSEPAYGTREIKS